MSIDVVARGLALTLPTKYVSGQYHMPDGDALMAGGAAMAAGAVRLTPGFIHKAVSITSLVVRIQTAAASGNVQISLYASDPVTNNPTGAPLFTSASQSTASVAAVEVATSQTLAPGLYWVGVQVDASGATAVFYSFNTAGATFWRQVGTATIGNMLNATSPNGYTKAGSFGTWPTLTGTGAGSDGLALDSSGRTPCWGFKVA